MKHKRLTLSNALLEILLTKYKDEREESMESKRSSQLKNLNQLSFSKLITGSQIPLQVALPAKQNSWECFHFEMQQQLQSNWCWAAVASSVAKHYDQTSGWPQCEIANQELGQTCCCTNGGSPDCDKPWCLDLALK